MSLPDCSYCEKQLHWFDAYLAGIHLILCETCYLDDLANGVAFEEMEREKR